jgi:hypothetical protein
MLSAFAPSKIIANYTHVHVDGIFEQMKGIVVVVRPVKAAAESSFIDNESIIRILATHWHMARH